MNRHLTRLLAQKTYLSLSLFVAVLWFAILASRPLFNPDEGRYAEISREMLASGDWIVPHLDGLAYIEKPPLQYWATAVSLRVFGNTEFGARCYTALCAWGTLCMVAFGAARTWGGAAGLRAAAALGGMLLFVLIGQLLTLDMSLTFYMTVSLVAFLLAQRAAQEQLAAQDTRRCARRWILVAWVATALGVLTKGPVAAAIPCAVLVVYSLYSRDYSPWRRLHARIGAPLFLLITVPWYWAAARRLPDFLEFFFIHEHLSRYLTPSAHREQSWWFFAAVFVVGSIPWTLSAVRVAVTGWRRHANTKAGFDPLLFLWVWAAFVIGFFSLSDSKLIPYILPAVPAVALCIGATAPQALRRELLLTAAFTLLAAIALAALIHWGPRGLAPSERNARFLLLAQPLGVIAALLTASAVFVLVRRGRDMTEAAVVLGTGWCLAGLLFVRAATLVAPFYSGVSLARALPVVPNEVPVFSVATYDQSLPFYWQHTVTLVAYRGELNYGLTHDAAAGLASVDDFVERWRGLPVGYAVMEIALHADLVRRGVPMRELAHDGNRVLVAR